MSTIIVWKSHATINAGSNASYLILGDDDTVLIGANSTVRAIGSALLVEASGAGDLVTIGGNGVWASDARDNIVEFAAAGTLKVLADSRTDFHGSGSKVTLSGLDNLGVYGAGDVVVANDALDGVWIGQNGESASGAAVDVVHGLTHGYLFELQGSNVSVDGSNYSATLTGDDVLTATGGGVHVTVTGADDVLDIGGNGTWASNGRDDVAAFQSAGTLNVLANSRVDAVADDSAVTLAGADTLGVYGAGDTIAANGTGDAIWLGQNGQNASGAAIDVVHGLTAGTLFELQGSDVTVDGANYCATLTGQDMLTATGGGVKVIARGAGNILDIGGDGASDDDVAIFLDPGVVNVLPNSSVSVFGNSVVANLPAVFFGASNFSLIGADDQVNAFGFGHQVTIGQNGGHGPVDTVTFSPTLSPQTNNVTELARSNVDVIGAGFTATLMGHDVLNVSGGSDTVNDYASSVGGNHIFLGPNQVFGDFYQTDFVNLENKGESVTLASDCGANLFNSGPASNGDVAVTLGGDDAVSVYDYFSLHVPTDAGTETIAGFSADDALTLANHFANAAALLGATTDAGGSSLIALDSTGDTLTLTGVDKTTFATYVQQGHVKFG